MALDVGCREGAQSEKIRDMGYKTISIDKEKKYDKCILVDINQGLPFNNNEFDLIWCSEVIEHLENPRKTIQEFFRVLKTGGRLIITTPNSYFWLYPVLKIFNYSPSDVQNKDHKHFFSIHDIRNILPDALILGYFPYIFLKFTIKRFIGFLSPTFVMIAKKS